MTINKFLSTIEKRYLNVPPRSDMPSFRSDPTGFVVGVALRNQMVNVALVYGTYSVASVMARTDILALDDARAAIRKCGLPLTLLIDAEYWHDHDRTLEGLAALREKYTHE